jgi:predicted transcriptional regulator
MHRRQNTQEDTRYRVLAILEKQPTISQRQLASALGISLGAVNYSVEIKLADPLILP